MKLQSSYQKLEAKAFSTDYRMATAVVTVPMPSPQADEVLVKNLYAGVNASDVNLLAGKYFADAKPPFDLGFEFAGEIVAVGSEVENLQPGTPIIGIRAGGGYREFQCIKAAEAIPVPQATPEVMSLLTVGLAASIGLKHVGEMKAGETVLVTAAAGGTGHIAVQLAKQAGCHVIGTCGNAEKGALLKELGCDRVIDYRKESVDEVLAKEYPTGVHLIFENVGGPLFDTCVKHLARLGRLVICGFVSEYISGEQVVTAPRIYHQLLWKSASLRAFLFSDFPELIPVHLGMLMEAMGQGKLKLLMDSAKFEGITAIPDAMEHLYKGKNSGRVVVKI